jgi:ribulose-5-phosphate 4-epimerase/fuculose-1-phosphate aldolase
MAVTAVSRPSRFPEDEWQVRVDLAACYRLFVRYGWTDLIYTHLTARVPGTTDQYLINPYGLMFDEITASSLLKVDFGGNVLEGDPPYNEAGHAIHTAVLKARPDINAVLHSHTRAGMAVSTMDCGLLPLTQQSNEIMAYVRRHPYDVATDSETECDRLGEDLGDGYALILENHGLLVAGRSMDEAFHFHYTLENACKVQVDALASGQKLVVPGDEALRKLAEYGAVSSHEASRHGRKAWPALMRMLDRIDPSYRS